MDKSELNIDQLQSNVLFYIRIYDLVSYIGGMGYG